MELLKSLLADYGLWVVLIGTFFEGETIVVIAGFAAHQGLLEPLYVALLAFAGSMSGDQFWFYMARHYREHPRIHRMTDKPAFKRALHFLEHHPTAFILSFRFIYGVRNVSPVVIGLSEISALRFFVLNAIAAAVWASTFTAIGYIFADTAERMLGKIKEIEHAIFVAIAVIGFVYLIYRVTRKHFGHHKVNGDDA